MGTISSGTGLISGMDIDSLVKQLMAIESKPLTLLKNQISDTQKQQTAYATLNANLLATMNAVRALAQPSAFRARAAASSNTAALTASVSGNTPVGTYAFQVQSLASTHQLVSTGFVDRDSTPLTGGTLTFKGSQARVDASTMLAALNGTQGVRTGMIRITDRAGGTATIDLSAAVSVDDVLQAINGQSTADVRVRVDGNRLVLTDLSGATTGTLRVQDLAGGFAAADLGLAGSSATGELTGRNLVKLVEGTQLSMLNDGMGVRMDGLADDIKFTFTDGSGEQRQIAVNLSGKLTLSTQVAALNDGRGIRDGVIRITNGIGDSREISVKSTGTVNDLMQAVNKEAQDLDVAIAIVGSKLVFTDNSGGSASHFKIEEVSGKAGTDLGIVTDTTEKSVSSGTLFRVTTMRSVLQAIQYADGNDGALAASLSSDSNSLVLTNTTGGGGVTVEALNGSQAARDLGLLNGATQAGSTLQGRTLLAGLNTVLLSSLNGGSGVGAGSARFTLRDGTNVDVDFTGAQTLKDIIDRINTAGESAGLSAAISQGGMGLAITDASTGSGTFSVQDQTGTTAADLHLTSTSAGQLASGDLNRRYISENTLLSSLHQGKGIKYGAFRITAADGDSRTVTLSSSTHKTIGDVIKTINALELDVEARITAAGDGIELVDHSGGGGLLSVTRQGSATTAADLGILGQATSSANVITGSFTSRITIGAGDTLDTLVEKINDASGGVTARVINDGTPYAPYRLVISSDLSGKQGQIAYDVGATGLSLGDMTLARNAVVTLNDGTSPNPVVVSSSTNTVTGVVEGLTLNLTGTSSQPVTVSVTEDTDGLVESVKAFADAFNKSIEQIDALTSYDAETQTKGVLLGDHTVQIVRDRLFNEVTRVVNASGLTFKSFAQIGIGIGSGAQLTVDAEKFQEAMESDPEGVQKLFTLVTKDDKGKTVNQGLGVRLRETLSDMTTAAGGLISTENQALQDRVDMFTDRVTEMQEMLDKKEARLYAQFQAMEESLAQLQSQQSAVSSLSTLVSSATSG